MKNKKIAVVGATGMVGQTFLKILYEKGVPSKNIFAIASDNSKGKKMPYGENEVSILSLEEFSFENVNVALFSPGSDISKKYAPKAVNAGCIVIDNTSAFRMDDDIPLIVPEINGHLVENFSKGIIANPNCSTIQMLMVLKPIHDLFKINKVIVSTYQSVSGAGYTAIDTLRQESMSILKDEGLKDSKIFSKPIGFNVIPKIDEWSDLGYTKEEWKMILETKKILDASIDVVATCVRVPVIIGHSISVHVTCQKNIDLCKLQDVINKSPGLILYDNPEKDEFITPIECVNKDDVFISRLRIDPFSHKSLSFWAVSDNVRKGAATNAIQIAELLPQI